MRRAHCFSPASCRVLHFFPVEKWLVVVIIASRHRAHKHRHNGHNDTRTLLRTQHLAERLTNGNNAIMCTIWNAVGRRHWELKTQQSWFHVFADDFPPNGFFLMVFFSSRQHSISRDVSMSIEDTYQSTSLLSILKETANDFWYFSPV